MRTRDRLARHFPVFGLEVRTPRLTLRYPDDDDLLELAELGARGVHDDDLMPFTVPWTIVPPPHQQRNTLDYFWSQRGTTQTDQWAVTLATVVDGAIVGSQGLMARDWVATRTFETGSWLGRAHQGQGIGKEMRSAVLHLGFAGFGARRATTFAYDDNPASLAVTASLGYRPNGHDVVGRGGEEVTLHRFRMDRADWEQTRRHDIEIVGAQAVVEVFGTAKLPAFDVTNS